MENKKKGKPKTKSKSESKNKLDNDKSQEIVKNISNLVDIDEKRSLQKYPNFSKRTLKERNLAVLEAANFAKRSIQSSQKESQDNPDEEKINSNNKKQLFWALGMMAFLVVLFLISYAAFNRIGKFEYEGLTFTKEKFGEIPVFHYYYFFDNRGAKYMYNLFLRNDPRTNNVPITGRAIDDGIIFDGKRTAYISIDPEGLIGCKYTSVGISSLTSFLKDNQIMVKGATPNYEQAELNNVEYITCKGNPNNDVIILKGGNETRIVRDSENCHIIEIANCEVLEAVEKFEVQAILDARENP